MRGLGEWQDHDATCPLLTGGLFCSVICTKGPHLVEFPPDMEITHHYGVWGGGVSHPTSASHSVFFSTQSISNHIWDFRLYRAFNHLRVLNSELFKRRQQGRGRGESLTPSFCFSPSLLQIMTNQEEGDLAEAAGLALHQGILSPPAKNLRAAGGAKLKFQQPLQGQESVWLVVQAHHSSFWRNYIEPMYCWPELSSYFAGPEKLSHSRWHPRICCWW